MSSLAFGALTAQRQAAPAGTSKDKEKPGIGTYIDVVAALVPAEVLAINAVLIPVMTTTSTNSKGHAVTTISSPGALKALFFISLVLGAGLYLLGHARQQGKAKDQSAGLRYLPMLIPPIAYIAWTMLQRSTAFDAIAPHMSEATRDLIAVVVAVLLSAVATRISFKADEQTPSPAPAPPAPAPAPVPSAGG